MRAIPFATLLGLGGCALAGQIDRQSPQEIFERGLVALEREDFRTAYQHMASVYEDQWDRPIGERALLTLAAVELDPRNPGRRLDVGAELAGRYFQLPSGTPWNGAVSQTLYLLAMELGAAEERLARAEEEKRRAEVERRRSEAERERAERERRTAQTEARRAAASAREARIDAERARAEARRARTEQRPAPAAPAPRPLPLLTAPSVSARVGVLQGERDRLEAEVRTLNRRLQEQEQELERIRRTLEPPR